MRMQKTEARIQLKKLYSRHRKDIENRMQEFKNLPQESWRDELLFCILTPQSNGKRCWSAIEEIRAHLPKMDEQQLTILLAAKTRFHKTKAKNLLKAYKHWPSIYQAIISTPHPPELREYLLKNVKGIGMKETSHFIRNIGKNNNTLAILDRHILRNLAKYRVIKNPRLTLTQKKYIDIERKFLKFSKAINIPIDHLDLLFWREGTGEIFK